MPKRVITVIAPDGSVHTRQTDRTYTHAVLVERSNAKLYAAAEASADYLERAIKDWENMDPSHNQYSCRTNNLASFKRRWAEALNKLSTMECTGTSWGTWSFNGSEALARKEAAKPFLLSGEYVSVRVVAVNP